MHSVDTEFVPAKWVGSVLELNKVKKKVKKKRRNIDGLVTGVDSKNEK